MSVEQRTDSLLAELRRQKLLDEYCAFFFSLRPLPPQRVEWMEKHGIRTSLSSVYRMHKGLSFRSLIAAMDADAYGESLPEDLDERTKKHLKHSRFEHSLGELTLKETLAMSEYYAGQDEMKFAEKKLSVQTRLKRRDQAIALRRLKGKIKVALDALSEEIGSIPAAQKHFDAMRAALKEARA